MNNNCSNPIYSTLRLLCLLQVVLEESIMLGCLYFTENMQTSNIALLLGQGAPETTSIQRAPFSRSIFVRPSPPSQCRPATAGSGEQRNCRTRLGQEATDDSVSQECLEILYMLCCYVILFLTFSIFILTQKSIKRPGLMSQDVGIEFP